MSNVTATQLGFDCEIPYEECLCSVQSTKNISLENCLTDHILSGHRISLLFSFIVQVCYIREMFTFSGKYSRFIVKSLWTTTVFIFAIIANGIYHRSSCFHRRLNGLLFSTGGTLFLLIIHDLIRLREIRSSYNNDIAVGHRDIMDDEIIDDETLEDTNNDSVSWKDLL